MSEAKFEIEPGRKKTAGFVSLLPASPAGGEGLRDTKESIVLLKVSRDCGFSSAPMYKTKTFVVRIIKDQIITPEPLRDTTFRSVDNFNLTKFYRKFQNSLIFVNIASDSLMNRWKVTLLECDLEFNEFKEMDEKKRVKHSLSRVFDYNFYSVGGRFYAIGSCGKLLKIGVSFGT